MSRLLVTVDSGNVLIKCGGCFRGTTKNIGKHNT
jgi:hypothetical protein